MRKMLQLSALAACALFLVPAVAMAQFDSGSTQIDEPNGFPGVCDQPCFQVIKTYEVYAPDDPANPSPLANHNTYVYTVEHIGGTGTPLGFIPTLTKFEIAVEADDVSSAGFITSADVDPSAVTVDAVNDVVSFDFVAPPIANGQKSSQLYIHSPLFPGMVTDTMVSVDGQASLDAPGTCVGPLEPPPVECTLDLEKEGCVVQPPDPGGDDCEGKALGLSFEYTGLGCGNMSHLQDPWAVGCYGDSGLTEPVDIVVYGYKRYCHYWGWWRRCFWRKTVYASETDVNIGDVVVVDPATAGRTYLPKRTHVKIRDSHGNFLEKVKFKTNCREPLGVGNEFGSVKITEVVSTQGGTVTASDAEEGECITTIDVSPPPHCIGKITDLTLRYLGGDCSQTNTTQWGAVTCIDPGTPTLDSVRLIITDGPPPGSGGTVLVDLEPVDINDLINLNAASLGLSFLPHELGFWIKRADDNTLLQDGSFLSRCQEPLNLGDQVGALQVFAITSTGGGANALGQDVDYTYKVTNTSTETVTNVSIDDDQLGNIVSGITLAPGEMQSFTATALIEETTTNVATASGDVNGQVCVEGTDDATITVDAPDPPVVCTSAVQAMRLRYTGPTKYGKHVSLTANDIGLSVDYGTIDLISGVTELTLPAQNGWTIDADAAGETALGHTVSIWFGHDDEVFDTTCCSAIPWSTQQGAIKTNGQPSTNWKVVDFVQE